LTNVGAHVLVHADFHAPMKFTHTQVRQLRLRYTFPMRTINIAQKLSLFSDHFSPKIVGQVNDLHVKITKMKGEFMWHHHDREDEMFLIVKGTLHMKIRENGAEREELIHPGEFIIIPHGVEHFPFADEEVHMMLIEPKETLNTGNLRNERTLEKLQTI
jgi:mannose-6-phosphate isomerase-like protein (cupin superfamily)